MDLFLSNKSPNTPAMGDNNNLGKIDIDNIDANIVAEPVIDIRFLFNNNKKTPLNLTVKRCFY